MGRLFSKTAGFTMIEIMIVSVVMGGLVTSAMSSYRNFEEKQRTVQAADDFVTHLRSVQKMADSGAKPSGCTGEFLGYEVAVTGNSSQGTVTAVCENISVPVEGITLRNGARFLSSAGVLFKPLGQGAVIGGASAITIHVQGLGQTYTSPVVVSSGGSVNPQPVTTETIPTATPLPYVSPSPVPTHPATTVTPIFPSVTPQSVTPTVTAGVASPTPASETLPAGSVTVVTSVSPTCQASGYGRQSVRWQPVQNAVQYHLQITCVVAGTTNTSCAGQYLWNEYVSAPNTSHEHMGLVLDGSRQYRYRVRVGSGNPLVYTGWSTRIDTTPVCP